GGQREIVTVRELTPEECQKYYPARYMIVSGERRWRAAKKGSLNSIEIRVKHYASDKERKLDAYMLNEGRVGLSDIEKALYIADLAKEWGWETQTEIAENIGESQMWVSQHLALLKLSPVAQAWMMPDVPEPNRLKMQPAMLLTHASHAEQDRLLEKMPKGKTAVRQVAWLRNELKQIGIDVVPRVRGARALRRTVLRLAEQVEQRLGSMLKAPEFDNIFKSASQAQTIELVEQTTKTLGTLQQFLSKVRRLADEHRLESAERKRRQEAAMQIRTPASPPVRVPQLSPPVSPGISKPSPTVKATAPEPQCPALQRAASPSPPQPEPEEEEEDIPPVVKPRKIVAAPFKRGESVFGSSQKPKSRPTTDLTVNYFDDNAGRMVMDKVSLAQYVRLWQSGKLKFQQQNTEKPEHLPTLEEAQALLAG
ncbi:MAG TPA: ParB N-terminal domain-containing protein, partial [Candidatus Paceibacterota bacterium]|nr:ParB N-terminal domain-containing protein [Candidatus Paceibacterota bacterium]